MSQMLLHSNASAPAIALAIALSLAAPMLHAQAKAQSGVWVEGGLTDCGDWAGARKSNRASNLEHYVIGTLNGMALGKMQDFWKADGSVTSQDSVFLWIDNYCQKNPFEKLTPAVTVLFQERTSLRH